MKAAVILSGCGFLDGAEIHESVLTYLALAEVGIQVETFAPDKPTVQVVSHLNEKAQEGEVRNVLEESARIARGKIAEIKSLNVDEFDVLWMPGGFRVASNLSNFSAKAENFEVDEEVLRVISLFYEKGKKIVGICIAPLVIAKALEGKGIEMTLGTNHKDMELLRKLGVSPVWCKVDQICVDEDHRIYSAPGYMEPPHIKGIFTSLQKIASKL